MKYIIKIISYLILAVIGVGCDETSVVEVDVKFEEKTIVYCELRGNEYFKGVRISRSVPVGSTIEDSMLSITKAEVYLMINQIQVIPLHHIQYGIYKAVGPFTIQEGSLYELFIEIGDKKIYAMTTIPIIPEIEESNLSDKYYLQTEFVGSVKNVYGAAWVIGTSNGFNISDKSVDFHSITEPTDNAEIVTVRTDVVPEIYRFPVVNEKLHMQVFAFDESFHAYFKSRNNNEPIKDVFSQGSGIVAWNVEGEDVIGLFIGISKSQLIRVR